MEGGRPRTGQTQSWARGHSHRVKSPDKAALVPVVPGDGRALCLDKGWTKEACLTPSLPSPSQLPSPPLGWGDGM